MGEERATRKVRMSPEAMDQWATRDHEGNRLSWDWGRPDADGWWEPVITVDRDDNLVDAERARLAAAVRGLEIKDDFGDNRGRPVVCGHIDGPCGFRAAVLALLDPLP